MLGLGLGLSKMRALLSSAASIITQNLQLWLDFEKSEVVGAEQVVNGGFDSSSNWNLNSNWSIANGLASTDGTSNTDANQGFTAVIGNSYEITIDIKNISQGSYRGSVGNSKTPYFTSVGVHSFVVVATSNDRIRIQGGNNPIGDLELISVKEISQFVEDKSTNTNNAKLFTGKAMSFDGVNDEVTIPNQALSGEFTTAIWFNTNSDTDNSLYGTSHSSCIRVRPNLPIPTIELRLGAIFSFEFSSFANQWSRLVMTRDSSDTIRCYINGVESTSGTTINSGIFNINSIGHPQNGWQYTGFTSDFQIYNKAWDSDDVTFDYNNPNHLVIDNPDSTLNKFNLKAYYPLCEGDGAIAYDYAPAFGDEEVVNGDFSNGSTDWDLRGLTTIINEVAGVDCPSTSYFLIQNLVMTAGLTYILTFDLTVDSGVMYNYSTYSPIQRSASGTYTETFVASSANLAFRSIGSFVGTMDNISVKEVLNPNHGTSYDGNGLDGANDVHDNDGTIYGATYVDKQPTIPQLGMMDWSKEIPNLITSHPPVNGTTLTVVGDEYVLDGFAGGNIWWGGADKVVGETYEVTVEITDYTSGLGFKWFPESSNYRKSVGVFTETIVASGTTLRMYVNGANTMKIRISNCSWKKVGGEVTLIQAPGNKGYDILGNALRLREHGFNLDGSGYAEVADDDSLDITTEITLECWLFVNDETDKGIIAKWTGTGKPYMMYKGNSGGNNFFRIYIDSVQLSSGTIPSNQWVHCVATYDGTTMKTYFNGDITTLTTKANSSAINTNSDEVEIGRYLSQSSKQYSERIDEPKIYNRALTFKEIQQNYKAGINKHKATSSYSDDYSSDYGL